MPNRSDISERCRYRLDLARVLAVGSVLLSALLLAPNSAATGWNDFRRQISPDFDLYKANLYDVGLCRRNGRVVLMPEETWGRIESYSVRDRIVFTRHYPAGYLRNNRQDLPIQHSYFIVQPDSDRIGPLTYPEFLDHPLVRSESVSWIRPAHPGLLHRLWRGVLYLVLGIRWVVINWKVTVPFWLLVVAYALVRDRRVRLG